MANVTKYVVIFVGTSNGYLGRRAQINLYDGNTFVGTVNFHDPDMQFPDDSVELGIIIMNLPSSMFANVLDVLRNEKPLELTFLNGLARLATTDRELVGEGE